MKKWFLAALIGAGAVLGGWLYAHGKLELPETAKAWFAGEQTAKNDAAQSALAPTVSVVAATETEFVETVLVTGSLVAREEIAVAPEVSGQRIVELLADVGDRVTAGQVLARLVTANLDAQLAQNAAARARAIAARAQAVSAIEQAKAEKIEADRALSRARRLIKSRDLAQSVYDQRLAAQRSAAARLASARHGLEAAEAEIAQADARRRELAWQRGRGEVTAPAGGLVSKRSGQVGAMASAAAMFQIIRNGEIELAAEVTAAQLAKMRVGQSARLVLPDGREFDGRVRLIAPSVDPASRLGELRIFIGNDDRLRIGTFVRGRVELARSQGLAVPAGAVMYGAGEAYVLVALDGKAVRRAIGIGLRMGERVEVARGLAEGDLVVAKAGTFLRDGDAIKPVLIKQTRVSQVR